MLPSKQILWTVPLLLGAFGVYLLFSYPSTGTYQYEALPCLKRAHCSWVHGNHSRYLIIGPVVGVKSGIGGHMARIAGILELAVEYNLHLVFRGNFTVTRYDETYNIQDTLGFTVSKVALSADDPILDSLPVRALPTRKAKRIRMLKEEIHVEKVVYDAGMNISAYVNEDDHLARQVTRITRHGCTSAGQVFRQLYENAPSTHHCSVFSRIQSQGRHYHIAVHIRRGDLLRSRDNGTRSRVIKHCYYVSTTALAIRALAKVMLKDSDLITIAVFSESSNGSLLDENGADVDIENDVARVCSEVGVQCKIPIVLSGDALEAFNCFTVADIFIGSVSRMSYGGGLLNPNVKVLVKYWQYQDTYDTVILDEQICYSRKAKANARQRLHDAICKWKPRKNCK